MDGVLILLIVLGSVLFLFLMTVIFYKAFFKRFWDIVLSFLAIVLLSPLYLLLTIAVRIGMGKPILFAQERIGRKGRIFKLYKFRSMTNDTDNNGNLLDESIRLTKFGTFLRSTSLDELPELFAILSGKMSIIGPRPQPKYYGPYYTEEEFHIYDVRGGLLPPDSLGGKPICSWDEQFKYELYYVKHVSLFLDLKVLFSTFLVLVRRLKTNYGLDERPHLNEYRESWNVPKELIDEWSRKGVGE